MKVHWTSLAMIGFVLVLIGWYVYTNPGVVAEPKHCVVNDSSEYCFCYSYETQIVTDLNSESLYNCEVKV